MSRFLSLNFKLSLSAVSLALVALLGTAGALVPSTDSRAADDKKASEPRPALTVSTVKPTAANLAARLPANGNIAAWQEASIGTESNGLRLTDVRVNVGDTVKAGQVLATFASETIQADVAQARANLLEAQANSAESQANAERARTLSQSGALSAQQIQQYTTAAQTSQARVEAAKAMLNAQQLRMKHTTVLAPDSGVISSRTATVGAVLGAGTELFRMVRKGRLEWRAEVASSELPRIKVGGEVNVTAASGAQVQGKVRTIAPTVDAQTRNAIVYVDLPAHADIRAGMFARGEFALGQRNAITVPAAALVVRDGFSSVFEVTKDSKVRMLRVQTGQRTGETVEITSGLKPDASVVARGGAFLNDGDLVRVQPAAAAAQ
ncbi:efflux RND transporter periplasmic adaptor subunit [Diaphorobacter sp. HDW4B]|uniref:efflux RND transporter periplasmic adaptor subunit n=1 Tax=Diaphorobacter sp. HDW4B TaxID=2714925 RepID=UPI00140A31D5|nr:efflux RND transporter periplasmic adaptor subunit [Diaphorobacter sp. HDW4B]QIL73536.1 efflux RND transporter periplasmic adaptor subunit [Diaphorobacter sp. HDW4B]